ncbi:MAG: 23S rRNA (uracil(1939)-C(5))-methyltransferase RlmD [Gloeobacteraceae cyanobacterium ES-bin-316]|nr:23S rRNA (uracil(1939)-C(5))-methyltransferase RlmD [Ferruginibacter sp.]
MRKNNKKIILEDVAVTDYAAEGKALAKIEGKVIFIAGAVPGDVADIMLTKNKKDWAEGRVLKIKEYSTSRVDPFCMHFGVCGGCKWQMLPYEKQLQYKQQEAEQNLIRIGKVTDATFLPIAGAAETVYYRNKLEFTFSNKRYLTAPPHAEGEASPNPSEGGALDAAVSNDYSNPLGIQIPPSGSGGASGALGYHAPRIFDKIIDIQECYLMDNVNNVIRNTIRDFAVAQGFSFYDIRLHTGWLRNIIIRYCSTGELMINICLNFEEEKDRILLLDHVLKEVPGITTLLYTINPKWNDSIYDLTPQVYFGKGYVVEKLEEYEFIISPKSFFQTNTKQAEKLYGITRDFAGLTGNEIVYDLYCGTGSIGIFISKLARKIIGVEAIEEAIEDAKKNAALNNINHAVFSAGDVIKICNDEFFATHGRPDVVITDPPRVGMHEKLVIKLLQMEAPRIVYVSCNTATQARDILLLSEKYRVEKIQPVDMFPHTHHIESVALLILK